MRRADPFASFIPRRGHKKVLWQIRDTLVELTQNDPGVIILIVLFYCINFIVYVVYCNSNGLNIKSQVLNIINYLFKFM